jgi:type II secretory pathway pseudopilin PulG
MHTGFSLVELLVVVGTIALLSALLLATITRSQEKARAVKCRNALHQIYLGTTVYADDNGGRLPHRNFFVEQNTRPPLCPSAKDGPHASADYGGYSWGIPYLWGPGSSWTLEKSISAIFVFDAIPWHDPGRIFDQDLGWGGRYNVLWGDGRIEWVYWGVRVKK